jgi:hypothetical protein
MIAQLIAPALLASAGSILVGISALVASLLTRRRARKLAASAEEHLRARWEEFQVIADALQKTIDGQAAKLSELELQTQFAALPAAHRNGLNIARRSQVLRLHRNGDPPDRIAATLELPLQEVALLIKVHQVVLGSM